MTLIDLFPFPQGPAGPSFGDIDVISGVLVLSAPVGLASHYHLKSLRVRSGATLQLPQMIVGAGSPTDYYGAIAYVEGDVLIEGTVVPIPTFSVATPGVAAINWDGADRGAAGGNNAGGTAGPAVATVPSVINQIVENGRISATASNYRYKHLFKHYYIPGGGGYGFRSDTGLATVAGGQPGGNVIIIARGTITISDSAGGIIDCKGTAGANAAIVTGAAGGGGGGAGGIIGLISYTKIVALAGAALKAFGGNGGNGAVGGSGGSGGKTGVGGGGGGGGLVFLAAPVVSDGLNVPQTQPGTRGTTASGAGTRVSFGGGGGGSFGAGGNGASPLGSSGFPGRYIKFEGFSAWQMI